MCVAIDSKSFVLLFAAESMFYCTRILPSDRYWQATTTICIRLFNMLCKVYYKIQGMLQHVLETVIFVIINMFITKYKECYRRFRFSSFEIEEVSCRTRWLDWIQFTPVYANVLLLKVASAYTLFILSSFYGTWYVSINQELVKVNDWIESKKKICHTAKFGRSLSIFLFIWSWIIWVERLIAGTH